MTQSLAVGEIPPQDHLRFVRAQRSASFLQTPAWGVVKSEWRSQSIGWFDGDDLVGAGLVLLRRLPKVARSLAYLPEGPLLDWTTDDLSTWLDPMVEHLRAQGCFGVRMGPPVVVRRWGVDALKAGLADPLVIRLDDIAPTERSPDGALVVSQLRELGWRQQGAEGGFTAGQPRFNFQLPLAGRTEEEVLRGMNQLWRRNIKKADAAGVGVARSDEGDVPADLKAFHDLYLHTAERDHFTPRPLGYFETMFRALGAEDPDRIRLYAARHDGALVAATVGIRVGTHAWYSYGASSTDRREVRGSNAIQWRMIRDAIAAGCDVYDLRGITDTLDEDDPHAGLIRFKVGTGGEAVEYAGEWDLPLSPLLYKAFSLYMSRR